MPRKVHGRHTRRLIQSGVTFFVAPDFLSGHRIGRFFGEYAIFVLSMVASWFLVSTLMLWLGYLRIHSTPVAFIRLNLPVGVRKHEDNISGQSLRVF